MGTWGLQPWGSDGAADWFGDLFDETGLAERVVEALEGDPEEDAEKIRAAASLLILLGRTYVWPSDALDGHLDLAVAQMKKVLTFQEGEFAEVVEAEISLLKARRKPKKGAPARSSPKGWGDIW